MLAASDGMDSELTLEKEQLRLSESIENKRGEEEDVEELSDGVVSRRAFRIRPENRCGNGAVFRFPGSLLLLGGERGTNVTGFEVGRGLWKTFEQDTVARTDGRSWTIFVGREYSRTIRDG